jgi:hypothetical protein
MKPVGKPDAGNRHVRFDERGRETGAICVSARARPRLYPLVDEVAHAFLRAVGQTIGLCGLSCAWQRVKRGRTTDAKTDRLSHL